MTDTPPASQKRHLRVRALLVDDDTVSLRLVAALLKKEGAEVVLASCGEQALEILREQDHSTFDCIFTDFQMPGLSGTELLTIIQNDDATLASVVITGQEEKKIISDSLRRGATDFLDKPINPIALREAMRRCTEATRSRRELRRAAEKVRAVADIQRRLVPKLGREDVGLQALIGWRTSARFFPVDETGGDFLNVFSVDKNRLLAVLGDVSGHGIKEGFIASYFQGIVRGMLQAGQPLGDVARFFNAFLLRDWNEDSCALGATLPTSLSALFVMLDFSERTIEVLNCGCPLPRLHNNKGICQTIGEGSAPLGWFDDFTPSLTSIAMPETGGLFLWSDGLEDHAHLKQLSSACLAARIASQTEDEIRHTLLDGHTDDVLVFHAAWSLIPHDGFFIPSYDETIPGDSAKNIDALQLDWRRNLHASLPNCPSSMIERALLVAREAALNALEHGCKNRPDIPCRICFATDVEKQQILVDIKDGGSGFASDNPIGRNDEEHTSYGLQLMRGLTKSLQHDSNGTHIQLIIDPKDYPLASLAPTPSEEASIAANN